MRVRMLLVGALMITCTFLAVFSSPVGAVQQERPTLQSAMLWAPALGDAGVMLAEHVNQIDANCVVDVDNVVATNGATSDGAVYAFAVNWACPFGASDSGNVWQHTMLWYPTLGEAGQALSDLLNGFDAECAVDVDPVVSTNGSGPEGAVYAFAVTWAC